MTIYWEPRNATGVYLVIFQIRRHSDRDRPFYV